MIFITTAGHGYLKITIKQLNDSIDKGAKYSNYSFKNRRVALLEEDVDYSEFLRVTGIDHKSIPETYQEDINRNCYTRL